MKKEIRKKVWDKFKGKCAYCGKSLKFKDLQVDHIKPKHLGGTDDLENLFPSCRRCNFYKSTFDIEKFRENLETLPDRLNRYFIFKVGKDYGFWTDERRKVKFYFEKVRDQDD